VVQKDVNGYVLGEEGAFPDVQKYSVEFANLGGCISSHRISKSVFPPRKLSVPAPFFLVMDV
jgi:hypothetical protein